MEKDKAMPTEKSTDIEFVRMYYEHQYDRVAKLRRSSVDHDELRF